MDNLSKKIINALRMQEGIKNTTYDQFKILVVGINEDLEKFLKPITDDFFDLTLIDIYPNKAKLKITSLKSSLKLEKSYKNISDELDEIFNDTQILFILGNISNNLDLTKEIAQLGRNKKILTLVILNKKDDALKSLKGVASTTFVVDKSRLKNTIIKEIERYDFMILKTLLDNILKPGLVGFDYADLKHILSFNSIGTIGIGISKNHIEAFHNALDNLLLDVDISKIEGALICNFGGKNFTLQHVTEISKEATKVLPDDASILLNAFINEDLNDEIMIKIIVTYSQ